MFDNTADVVGFDVFWIKLQSAGVIDNSAVKVALGLLGESAVVIGRGRFWIKLQGTGVIGNGTVKVAIGVLSSATFDVISCGGTCNRAALERQNDSEQQDFNRAHWCADCLDKS